MNWNSACRILRDGRLRLLRLGRVRRHCARAWRPSRCCARCAARAPRAATALDAAAERGSRDEAAPQAPGDRRRHRRRASASPPRWCSTPSRATWCSSIRRRRWPPTRRRAARTFRLGGMVEQGSVKRDGTARCSFVVTDTAQDDPGALRGHPARPVQGGQGRGRAGPAAGDGVFVASEVLAKHDENYMPPEAAEALKQRAAGQAQLARADAAGVHGSDAMIPELGHFALWLALGVGAGARHRCRWSARRAAAPTGWRWRGPAARRCSCSIALAFGCLALAFVAQRLLGAVRRAATRTRALPLHYRIAAVWGGHEGSMLLWLLMLAGWTLRGGAASAGTCRDAVRRRASWR